ncbi:MAG: tetratricopeptide repeat protein [Thermoanaerobaculia bacterium]
MGGLKMARLATILSSLLLAAAAGGGFVDLWWTADQQGRRHFERGDYTAAADRFADPMWQGAAAYRAGNFELAADSFARVNSPEASFNLGNAYSMLGRYEEAVAAFEAALADRPEWPEAIDNRDAVQPLLEQPELSEEEGPPGDPSFDPDEIQFDEKGEQGKTGEIERSQLTDEHLAEMWLRRLQASPASYLRQRFAVEAAADEPETEP